MAMHLRAACGCDTGKIRSNNEDNFYFNGRGMSLDNMGLEAVLSGNFSLNTEHCFGVFDGMGGEEFGEMASFAAVDMLKRQMEEMIPENGSPKAFLEVSCDAMNEVVCAESVKMVSGRMGTTAAILLFVPEQVYVCNLGDSRIYRLRNKTLSQISCDHVEKFPAGMQVKRKPRLTQYLGIFPDEMMIEPQIAVGEVRKDDIYLICSDGITDMLTDGEICRCLKAHRSPIQIVRHLIDQALAAGGKDNITAIVISVQ